MGDNIFEKLTPEEGDYLWMYMIFNRDKIIEKTKQWTKEAEKKGMTLTEYLESINPLDKNKEELPNNICTQKCCLKNHNVGIIECDEKNCSNRTKW